MDWWSGQAFHNQNPGGAHILVNGEHVWSWETTSDRVRVCSPTFDGGSSYFRERHGADSRRGGLVYTTVGRHPIGITLV